MFACCCTDCHPYLSVGSRQVVLFPRGTRHTSASVSLYIKCLLPQAHPRAVFSLAIVNDDHGKTIVKGVPAICAALPGPPPLQHKFGVPSEAAHKFSPQADDWGFAAFAEQNLIYAQDAGFFSAESGRLTITLTVHLDPEVQDAQDAVCCHHRPSLSLHSSHD